jgi:hypothetical protein
METPNAFVGHALKPTSQELSAALGATSSVWNQLVEAMTEEYGVNVQEWTSYSLKAGWALRLKLKKRNILYMSPCEGCFQVAFILGDKAMKAVKQIKFPQRVATSIENATRYPEGTGVRLLVKKMTDLASIQKLAAIKLAN